MQYANFNDVKLDPSVLGDDVVDANALESRDMGELAKGWRTGRIGMDVNRLNAKQASLRNDGDLAGGDALNARINALKQQQGYYAPKVGKVENIDSLGSGLDWAAGAVGQGVASSADSLATGTALNTAATAASFLPGYGKAIGLGLRALAPAAMYAQNLPQSVGETYGAMKEDKTIMANNTAQQLYEKARNSGMVQAGLDTALPGYMASKLGGAGLRSGISAMNPLQHAGIGMLGEGATETAQEMIKQRALTDMNANRDKSGDFSDNINSFAGGLVGSGPTSMTSAAADAGFRRGGVMAGQAVDYAGRAIDAAGQAAGQASRKAGDVVDLLNDSEPVQAAKKKIGGWWRSGQDAAVDLQDAVTDENGNITPGSVGDAASKAAGNLYQNFKNSVEEDSILRNHPPMELMEDPSKTEQLKEWLMDNEVRRTTLVINKLREMPDDPKSAELFANLTKAAETGDSTQMFAAEDAAADHLTSLHNHADLAANVKEYTSLAQLVTEKAGNLIGRAAVGAGKVAGGIIKSTASGVRQGFSGKKNLQTNQNAEMSSGDYEQLRTQRTQLAEHLFNAAYTRAQKEKARQETLSLQSGKASRRGQKSGDTNGYLVPPNELSDVDSDLLDWMNRRVVAGIAPPSQGETVGAGYAVRKERLDRMASIGGLAGSIVTDAWVTNRNFRDYATSAGLDQQGLRGYARDVGYEISDMMSGSVNMNPVALDTLARNVSQAFGKNTEKFLGQLDTFGGDRSKPMLDQLSQAVRALDTSDGKAASNKLRLDAANAMVMMLPHVQRAEILNGSPSLYDPKSRRDMMLGSGEAARLDFLHNIQLLSKGLLPRDDQRALENIVGGRLNLNKMLEVVGAMPSPETTADTTQEEHKLAGGIVDDRSKMGMDTLDDNADNRPELDQAELAEGKWDTSNPDFVRDALSTTQQKTAAPRMFGFNDALSVPRAVTSKVAHPFAPSTIYTGKRAEENKAEDLPVRRFPKLFMEGQNKSTGKDAQGKIHYDGVDSMESAMSDYMYKMGVDQDNSLYEPKAAKDRPESDKRSSSIRANSIGLSTGDHDVRMVSAHSVMEELGMEPREILDLYRGYLHQDATEKTSRDTFTPEQKKWMRNEAHAVEAFLAENAPADPHDEKQSFAHVLERAATYFKRRFMISSVQQGDAIAHKLQYHSFIEMQDLGARALSFVQQKKPGDTEESVAQRVSDANIIMFKRRPLRKKEGLEGEEPSAAAVESGRGYIAIPAGALVRWVREQEGGSTVLAKEASKSVLNKNRAYQNDVLQGIAAVLDSNTVDTGENAAPYKLNAKGERETLSNGVFPSLNLVKGNAEEDAAARAAAAAAAEEERDEGAGPETPAQYRDRAERDRTERNREPEGEHEFEEDQSRTHDERREELFPSESNRPGTPHLTRRHALSMPGLSEIDQYDKLSGPARDMYVSRLSKEKGQDLAARIAAEGAESVLSDVPPHSEFAEYQSLKTEEERTKYIDAMAREKDPAWRKLWDIVGPHGAQFRDEPDRTSSTRSIDEKGEDGNKKAINGGEFRTARKASSREAGTAPVVDPQGRELRKDSVGNVIVYATSKKSSDKPAGLPLKWTSSRLDLLKAGGTFRGASNINRLLDARGKRIEVGPEHWGIVDATGEKVRLSSQDESPEVRVSEKANRTGSYEAEASTWQELHPESVARHDGAPLGLTALSEDGEILERDSSGMPILFEDADGTPGKQITFDGLGQPSVKPKLGDVFWGKVRDSDGSVRSVIVENPDDPVTVDAKDYQGQDRAPLDSSKGQVKGKVQDETSEQAAFTKMLSTGDGLPKSGQTLVRAASSVAEGLVGKLHSAGTFEEGVYEIVMNMRTALMGDGFGPGGIVGDSYRAAPLANLWRWHKTALLRAGVTPALIADIRRTVVQTLARSARGDKSGMRPAHALAIAKELPGFADVTDKTLGPRLIAAIEEVGVIDEKALNKIALFGRVAPMAGEQANTTGVLDSQYVKKGAAAVAETAYDDKVARGEANPRVSTAAVVSVSALKAAKEAADAAAAKKPSASAAADSAARVARAARSAANPKGAAASPGRALVAAKAAKAAASARAAAPPTPRKPTTAGSSSGKSVNDAKGSMSVSERVDLKVEALESGVPLGTHAVKAERAWAEAKIQQLGNAITKTSDGIDAVSARADLLQRVIAYHNMLTAKFPENKMAIFGNAAVVDHLNNTRPGNNFTALTDGEVSIMSATIKSLPEVLRNMAAGLHIVARSEGGRGAAYIKDAAIGIRFSLLADHPELWHKGMVSYESRAKWMMSHELGHFIDLDSKWAHGEAFGPDTALGKEMSRSAGRGDFISWVGEYPSRFTNDPRRMGREAFAQAIAMSQHDKEYFNEHYPKSAKYLDERKVLSEHSVASESRREAADDRRVSSGDGRHDGVPGAGRSAPPRPQGVGQPRVTPAANKLRADLDGKKERLASGVTAAGKPLAAATKNKMAEEIAALEAQLGTVAPEVATPGRPKPPLRSGAGKPSVVESRESGYRARTQHNVASAGATVAIACNFDTGGERLTRNTAQPLGKYVAINYAEAEKDSKAAGKKLADFMAGRNTTTLNVAGNGIYTLHQERNVTQADVDRVVFGVISAAHAIKPITNIVSGGQTGVDIAGASAAMALGIPATITLPRGFMQRDAAMNDSRHTKDDIERQIQQGAERMLSGAGNPTPPTPTPTKPTKSTTTTENKSGAGVSMSNATFGEKRAEVARLVGELVAYKVFDAAKLTSSLESLDKLEGDALDKTLRTLSGRVRILESKRGPAPITPTTSSLSEGTGTQRKLNAMSAKNVTVKVQTVAAAMMSAPEIMRAMGFKAAPLKFANVASKLLTHPDSDMDSFIRQSSEALSHVLMHEERGDIIRNILRGDAWFAERAKYVTRLMRDGMPRADALAASYRPIVQRVLAAELKARSENEKSVVGRIKQMAKDIVSQFKGVVKTADFADVVRNMLNDAIVKQLGPIDLKANYKKVSFQDAVDGDRPSANVLAHMSTNPNTTITGSIVLADNGSIYRDASNMLHDLDFVVKGTKADAEAHLRAAFPGAVQIYDFKTPGNKVDTFIVPPPGTTVANIVREGGKEKVGRLKSYSVMRGGREVGRTWNDENGEHKSGEAGTLVDFFTGSSSKPVKHIPFYVAGKKYSIPATGPESIFDAKLSMGRSKDIKDYLNYVPNSGRKLNQQNDGDTHVATDAEMAEAVAYAKKTMGPELKVMFKDITGYSGEFLEAENTIVVSTTAAAGTLGTLYHEAMHKFFADFVRGNPKMIRVFESLVNDDVHVEKLHALLDGYPEAQAQLHGPGSGEERLSYTFQFWKAGLIQVDAEARTWMQKIGKFLRAVFGHVRDSERALELFKAFDNGKMSEPSAAGRVIAAAMERGTNITKLRRQFDGLTQGVAALTMASGEILDNSASPTARMLGKIMFTNPGDESAGGLEPGLMNARRQLAQRYTNIANNVLENMDPSDMNTVQKYMQEAVDTDAVPLAEHKAAVKKLRALLDRFHDEMVGAGMKVGKIEKYYPVVWNPVALEANKDEFIKMLLDKYSDKLKVEKGVTAAAAAEGIWRLLISNEGVEGHKEVAREDGVLSPFFAGQEKRTFEWIAPADRAKYLEKNMPLALSRYFAQGAHATEYFRRFGKGGERLDTMLRAIQKELSLEAERMHSEGELKTVEDQNKWTARQLRDIHMSVGAMEGVLGKDVSPNMRKFNSWMTVYQNVRLLPMALFSSVVDPLAVVARGAPLQAAYETLTYSLREVWRGWRDSFSDLPPKREKDEWRKLAEHIGASEIAAFQHHVSEEYSSGYMTSGAKKINDKMFTLNGMEALNRGTRIMATKWAVRFIEKHASLPEAHSKRWLAELGLTPADIDFDDGKLVTDWHTLHQVNGLSAADARKRIGKIYNALNRWVEGAVLTPNAAQRPAWSSDPNYATLFHLKQFSYSFHQTILKRVRNEAEHGNYAPVGALAAFIPTMIVSDLMKGLIQGGGTLPSHMAGMNAGDWFAHGAQRAGLIGVGVVAQDAVTDWSSLGGPAFEQIADAFGSGFDHETLVKSLPLNSVYKEAL